MRFSDKLPKLRKDNNLSQEQLADKLGVSRQAVSKWESGSSYPDMEKILQMCKILNCHLEDLMDDGTIGNNSTQKSKFDINVIMKDFLDFITRAYNMFCSMKFKEKIKCIFEMALIAIVLIVVSKIIYSVLGDIIYGLIPIWGFWAFVSKIIFVILFAISFIIFIHLFKIRYLDYFITVEDQNVTKKTIEEPVEKKENRYYEEKTREKIVIRDPKHSTSKFIEAIGRLLIAMIKVFVIFATIPIIILFILSVCVALAAVYHILYGTIFLFITIAIIGELLLLYDVIELIYNFIVDRQQHFKRIFILGIIGLVMCGAGLGLSICSYLNYEKVDDYDTNQYKVKEENIEMQDNLYIIQNSECDYKIDNSVSDIQIKMKYIDGFDISCEIQKVNNYEYCYIYYDTDPISAYKILIQDLKEKKIRNYDKAKFIKIEVTTSQENYDKLQQNYIKFVR